MKGCAIPYSAAERAWLEANRRLTMSDYHRRFYEKFGRADVTPAHLHALRKRNGWKTGRTGHFAKGNAPHNKGKPFPTAREHPNCRRNLIKKGERRGVAVSLYKPIGTERITKCGYLERKVNDGLPARKRWRLIHLINWEAANGPLPEGHALKCLDGDRTNTDPANWKAVPRAMLPRLAGRFGRDYDNAPAELKPSIMAVAELEHAAREAGK